MNFLGRRISVGLGALAALFAISIFAPAGAAGFGIADFSVTYHDANDAPVTQAGAHPNQSVKVEFEQSEAGLLDEAVKDIQVDLPAGFFGDPMAAPRCLPVDFSTPAVSEFMTACAPETQVGILQLQIGPDPAWVAPFPIYNIEPMPGETAVFGFSLLGPSTKILISTRTGSDNGVRATIRNISQTFAVYASTLTLWGVPSDPSNDMWRFSPDIGFPPFSSDAVRSPFLTLPTRCDEPLAAEVRVRTWQSPGEWHSDNSISAPLEGCEELTLGDTTMEFEAQAVRPEADTPTGMGIAVKLPFNSDPDGLSNSVLRDAKIVLPEGTTISPSVANGLTSCTDAEVGLNSSGPSRCPEASKIGTVNIETPLLSGPLTGAVYTAEPEPAQLFRIFLVAEGFGVSIRLAGDIDPDPVTGQLAVTFRDLPQLPFTDLEVRLNGGPRAPLVNARTCGAKESQIVLTPWSAPQSGPASELSDVFRVESGPNGLPCPAGISGRPFAPGFNAGVVDPGAGGSSSFTIQLTRPDGHQELKALRSVKLPEGLLGAVGTLPLCEAVQAASGSCPEASRIGHVQLAAGAGATPLWVPQAGKESTAVYLTGPYKGAPYGLSIKVPAEAGPFDLGDVIVRSALHVDERTTQITTAIDETRLIDRHGRVTDLPAGDLPRILEGVVLNQREIRVIIDREDFMVNPTDCSPKQVTAEMHGYGGANADLGSPFRAADCAALDFAPRFGMRIMNPGRRSTLRSFNPRARFAVAGRPGDANIGRAAVTLPPSIILDQANIRTVCVQEDFAARDCPEGAVYGWARAWSPLLNKPVQGPVYLRANRGARPLPDLVADMDGEVRVVLEGWIDTVRRGQTGRLRTRFAAVPDVPVTRFQLTMRGGGSRGLLVNSTDLCRSPNSGVANFRGQNARRHVTRPPMGLAFRGCQRVRRQAARRMAQRKASHQAVYRSGTSRKVFQSVGRRG